MKKNYCGKLINEGTEIISNCKHFRIGNENGQTIFQCVEPKNLKGNPLAEGFPNLAPHEKNAKCNCPDFKKMNQKEAIEKKPKNNWNLN